MEQLPACLKVALGSACLIYFYNWMWQVFAVTGPQQIKTMKMNEAFHDAFGDGYIFIKLTPLGTNQGLFYTFVVWNCHTES